MKATKAVRIGTLIFAVFAILAVCAGSVAAYIDITSIDISRDDPRIIKCNITRVGYIEYQNTEQYNASGNLTVILDGIVVLETEVETKVYQIGNVVINPVRWKCFSINESMGMHTIVAIIVTDDGWRVTRLSKYKAMYENAEEVEVIE